MMNTRPHMIGIAGATCSGKSRLARHLRTTVPEKRVVLLHMDAYYRDLSAVHPSERENRNFDTPEAIDHELFHRQIATLSTGRAISGPVYDFSTHTRSNHSVQVTPEDVVIVEGLFVLFWEEVRRLLHTKVFIDLPAETSLARRLERDVKERGRTRESVLRQYHQTVKPMTEQSVLPTRQFADVVVNGEAPVEDSAAVVVNHLSACVPQGRG